MSSPSMPPPPPEPAYGAPTVGGPRQTDGFSIAALVLGLIGFSVLGLIFGFIGLSRTKNGQRGGRGMAIAGIVLSFVWIVVSIALDALVFVVGNNVRTEAENSLKASGFYIGDCIGEQNSIGANSGTYTAADTVSCYEPHQVEIIGYYDDADCDTYRGTLSSAYEVTYWTGQVTDSYNSVEWCAAMSNNPITLGTGFTYWTGSFYEQDVSGAAG